MKPPAFQFYVDNFREGVCDMTQDEVGAYILLLCYQWSQGAIPKDRARMERAAAGSVSDHVLRKFGTCADGELRNARLEREREKQTAFRESRAINGAKGGRPKASGLHTVLNGEPKPEAKESSPVSVSGLQSPLSDPDSFQPKETTPRERGTLEEISAFCVEIGLPKSDGEASFHKWEGNGWKVGNAQIKCWRSTIRSWKAAGYMPSQKQQPSKSVAPQSQFKLPGHR